MNNSGDAAEQVVRMSLEGVEVAAKVTGSVAKETIVMIMAALKSKDGKLKTKGKTRLTTMLKSGQPLEIFSVRESDLKQFVQGAKQYGIVYCALKNTKNCPDGMVDIMVKAEDAPKINRIVERFHLATVEKAQTAGQPVANQAENEIHEPKSESQTTEDPKPESPKPENPKPGNPRPEKNDGKTHPPSQQRPLSEAPNPPPSGPTSNTQKKSEKPISSKPSVKEQLREIKVAQNAKSKEAPSVAPEPGQKTTKPEQPAVAFTQPKKGGKLSEKTGRNR